jgi:hypothetical protein
MGLSSDVVIFDALNKTGDNRLYSICKIILDLRENTPHFDENLRRKVKKDAIIAGNIGIFSSKYNKLLKVLKNYDLDGFIYSLIEEGELGKVHNILMNAINASDISVKSEDMEDNLAPVFDDDEEEEEMTARTSKINIEEIMKFVEEESEE